MGLPPLNDPLNVAVVMSRWPGRAAHMPRAPFGALALTLMPDTSSQWPEVSISHRRHPARRRAP